jgi:hypothetical protein
MTPHAWTPEELETLLEDAFVLRDRDALAALFEDGGLLAREGSTCVGAQIRPFATSMFERDVCFVASPRRIVQARDIALVLSDTSISVMRRTPDGNWQYAITLLDSEAPNSARPPPGR